MNEQQIRDEAEAKYELWPKDGVDVYHSNDIIEHQREAWIAARTLAQGERDELLQELNKWRGVYGELNSEDQHRWRDEINSTNQLIKKHNP